VKTKAKGGMIMRRYMSSTMAMGPRTIFKKWDISGWEILDDPPRGCESSKRGWNNWNKRN
jgi:hypothetical protein